MTIFKLKKNAKKIMLMLIDGETNWHNQQEMKLKL